MSQEKHGKTSTPLRARTAEYHQDMKQAETERRCIFCPPYNWKNPPIRKFTYWIFKKNDYPYKHSLHHFVVIHREHGATDNDIHSVCPEAWKELGEIVQWAVMEYDLPGGGIVIRFGNPDFNASTMRHLHVHIQVPDKSGNVKATFYKDYSWRARLRRKLRSWSWKIWT